MCGDPAKSQQATRRKGLTHAVGGHVSRSFFLREAPSAPVAQHLELELLSLISHRTDV